jgi:hypothetical protein
MTPEEVKQTLASLGELELIKKVNEEYSFIHQHDKMDYSHAIVIGEALNELKYRRIVPHGKWQAYLKERCPKVSYETANIYMRVAKNQKRILEAATAKNVAATDLTIAFAREVLAQKPKEQKEPEPKEPKLPTKSATPSAGVMPDDEETELGSDFEEELVIRDADELFLQLKDMWDVGKLRKLHALLGEHIMKLSAAPQIVAGAATVLERRV